MPSLAGLESGGKRGLCRRFHQLMHDAGMDRREITNPAGRKFAKCSFHTLSGFLLIFAKAEVRERKLPSVMLFSDGTGMPAMPPTSSNPA